MTLKRKKNCYPEKGYQVLPRVGWLGSWAIYLLLFPLQSPSAHSRSLWSSSEDPACSLAHHTDVIRGRTICDVTETVNSQTQGFMRDFLTPRSKADLSQVPFINIITPISTYIVLLFYLHSFYTVYLFVYL